MPPATEYKPSVAIARHGVRWQPGHLQQAPRSGIWLRRTSAPVWGGECARLMTNCIIYYNALLLSRLLDYKEAAGDVQEAALLKHISPVAWQHINLYGRYEFRHGPAAININEMVRELAQLPVWQVMPG
jgi:hypothetical protein